MQTLTVKIASSGTVFDGGGKSLTGHMWVSIDQDGDGPLTAVSMGFAPIVSSPFWQGKFFDSDDSHYTSTYYTGTINISAAQYTQLINFGQNPSNYGFSAIYLADSNNYVDFTWKALQIIGINPSGFQGDILPTLIADNVDSTLHTYLTGGLNDWKADGSAFSGYDVIYGSSSAE